MSDQPKDGGSAFPGFLVVVQFAPETAESPVSPPGWPSGTSARSVQASQREQARATGANCTTTGFLYTPGNGHAKRSYPEGDLEEHSPGMTLRDYFAGRALTGLVVGVNDPDAAVIARLSYEQADAMLTARKTGGQS